MPIISLREGDKDLSSAIGPYFLPSNVVSLLCGRNKWVREHNELDDLLVFFMVMWHIWEFYNRVVFRRGGGSVGALLESIHGFLSDYRCPNLTMARLSGGRCVAAMAKVGSVGDWVSWAQPPERWLTLPFGSACKGGVE